MKKYIYFIVVIMSIVLFTSIISAYDVYKVGDVVQFANSNWIVIKDSNSEDDYVIALKEKLLTHDELGEYAANPNRSTMAFYYSDTCYYTNTYGHDIFFKEGCPSVVHYDQSKVKEFLENYYLKKLGDGNLKDISGYKIRLMYSDEITSSLNQYVYNGYLYYSLNAEEWLYKDLDGNILEPYWSYRDNSNNYVFYISFLAQDNQVLYAKGIFQIDKGIRPVINLLKSSITNIDDNSTIKTDEKNTNIENNIINKKNISGNDSSIIYTSEVLKVPNTLQKFSIILIMVGIVIVSVSIVIVLRNKNIFDKKKVDKK